MENSTPSLNPSQKNEWLGYYVPKHTASLFKNSMENNNSPLLPDPNGNVKTIPITHLKVDVKKEINLSSFILSVKEFKIVNSSITINIGNSILEKIKLTPLVRIATSGL